MLMEFDCDSGMQGQKAELARILDAAQELRETKAQMRASGFLSAADVAFLQKPFELPEGFDRDFFHVALHGAHVENEPLTLNKDWFAKQSKEFRSGFWKAYCQGGATGAALYLGADPIDMDAINERLRLAQEARSSKRNARADLKFPEMTVSNEPITLEVYPTKVRYVTPYGDYWRDFVSPGAAQERLRGLPTWTATVVVIGLENQVIHCSSGRSASIALSTVKKTGNGYGTWKMKAIVAYPIVVKRMEAALCS